MGVCICKNATAVITREMLQRALVSAIDNNDIVGLEDMYAFFMKKGNSPYSMPVLDIEEPIVNIHGVEMNALAYAFRHGREEIARFLIEEAGCTQAKLFAAFRPLGKTPLHILCEYGHTDLLVYYLPLYQSSAAPRLSSIPSFHESYEELSIFSDGSQRMALPLVSSTISQTPAHKACEKGQIDVLRILVDFGKEHGTFREIDVHAEDEKTGENCALISCHTGNLPMMRFLNEDCGANFQIKNKRKENALQLSLLGAKRQNPVRFLECVRYLVEKVKIDILYEYEETLLLVEDSVIQEYLEMKLIKLGVMLTKQKVEEVYAIGKNVSGRPSDVSVTKGKAKGPNANFQLQEVFQAELASKSYLSSITPLSDLSHDFGGTSFSRLMSL